MTVYFIGAGPGAPDLLTLRGRDLIARCPVCLFAGSLVPREIIAHAPANARVVDTAALSLEEIIDAFETAHAAGHDVARVHSGDPSIYGAIGEQMRALDARNIAYEIVPGVPAFAAVAASLKCELTEPGIAQTVILTRTATRSSPMPAGEDLATLAQSGATLAIHLSAKAIDRVCAELIPLYGVQCPAAVVARATWPDEISVEGKLGDIAQKTRDAGIERTALILIGPVLGDLAEAVRSRLYDAGHDRHLRPARKP